MLIISDIKLSNLEQINHQKLFRNQKHTHMHFTHIRYHFFLILFLLHYYLLRIVFTTVRPQVDGRTPAQVNIPFFWYRHNGYVCTGSGIHLRISFMGNLRVNGFDFTMRPSQRGRPDCA